MRPAPARQDKETRMKKLFARTAAEREAQRDPRLSLQDR